MIARATRARAREHRAYVCGIQVRAGHARAGQGVRAKACLIFKTRGPRARGPGGVVVDEGTFLDARATRARARVVPPSEPFIRIRAGHARAGQGIIGRLVPPSEPRGPRARGPGDACLRLGSGLLARATRARARVVPPSEPFIRIRAGQGPEKLVSSNRDSRGPRARGPGLQPADNRPDRFSAGSGPRDIRRHPPVPLT